MQRPAVVRRHVATSAIVARKDGRQLHRMTIYAPDDVWRCLRAYCAANDVEMSAVTARALFEFLERKEREGV